MSTKTDRIITVPKVVRDGIIADNAVMSVNALTDLGVSSGELRGPGFVRLLHGVFTPASNPELGSEGLKCRAAVVATDSRAIVCGPSALRLFGVQLPSRFAADTRVHLLFRRANHQPQRNRCPPIARYGADSNPDDPGNASGGPN